MSPTDLDNLLNTNFGVLLNPYDFYHPYLANMGKIVFEQPFTRILIERKGERQAREFLQIVNQNGQIIYMHPSFWHLDIEQKLKQVSSIKELQNYMEDIARFYMEYAAQNSQRTGEAVLINFVNEP